MENINPKINHSQKKSSQIFLYLSIVLFIICCVLTWRIITFKQEVIQKETIITQVSNDKDLYVLKLENLQKEYDRLGKENTELSEMFLKEKEHVKKLLKKVKSSTGSIEKYKKQVFSLESRLKEYEQQIEQLKSQNKALIEENISIKTALDSTTGENKNLNIINTDLSDKISKGSELVTYDFSASGIISKSNGKEIPTAKSKRADKIKVCFTIGENSLAQARRKDIYLRVAGPNGDVLCKGKSDDYSFTFEGKPLQYSVKDQIDYNNKAVDVCMYWVKTSNFEPGTYYVDIFTDGKNIGSSTFKFEK